MATPYPPSHNVLLALLCSLAAASATLNPVIVPRGGANDQIFFARKDAATRDSQETESLWSMPTLSSLPGSTFFTGQPLTQTPESAEARTSNAIYFATGISTFILAMALIQFVLRKLNFLEEPEEDLPQQNVGNPQDEEPVEVPQEDQLTMARRASRRASLEPEHPGNHVPFRMQQVFVAWLFIVASTSFFCDYLAVQAHLDTARHYFGMTAAFLWLIGFLTHFHWQLTVGTSRTHLFAAFFKVKACVMIQVHPFCMIAGMAEDDPIVWWPGLAGLALWHTGNIISCITYFFNPPASSDRKKSWLDYGNLGMTELVIDTVATKLLCIASICVAHWWGDPKNQMVDSHNYGVVFCEFGGAFLFMLASCVKCEWCNGFRNFTQPVAGSRGSNLLGPGSRTGPRPQNKATQSLLKTDAGGR
jgi:hypothetical protein